MKRYLAFATPHYYPSGGMKDCIGHFDTVEDAKASLDKLECYGLNDDLSEGHIFDLHDGVIVFEYDNDACDAANIITPTELDIFNKEPNQ